ncbi:MAG: hypothetical protein AB7K68_11775 [Bacteriovoracia bacterium]
MIFSLLFATLSLSSAQAGNIIFQYLPEYGAIRLRAECTIEKETRECAIDTGAPQTMTAPSVLKEEHEVLGEVKMGSIGMSVICQRLAIPGFNFAGSVRAAEVLSCPGFFESLSPTIGMDSFDARRFLFDFSAEDLKWDPIWESPTQPFRRLRHWLVVPGSLNGRGFEMGFDTGAPVTLVDQKFVDANPDLFTLSTEPPSEMLIRRNMRAYVVSGPIRVGDVNLEATFVYAGDFSPLKIDFPIILGANHLVQAAWYFDLKADRWGIRRY